MASLNLSINGPSIKSSYASVVNGPQPSSSSPTAAHWALFSVQAPLLNAFQDTGSKESVLKVQSTDEGELADLVEDFNEGRIQFAFVKVKDPNTGLPKLVLIAWCGAGVPERTKGYFTSHVAAVSKVLHGYHVQITARSDSDLVPEAIIQKVADASGAKYSVGSAPQSLAVAPPPVAKKPVFTPTTSSSRSSFNPVVASRSRKNDNADDDGWGPDAPQITRSQLEKVESAYKPTKVNMSELVQGKSDTTRFAASSQEEPSDVVKGGYQPIGKVDIAAIRAQAKQQEDDRPTAVKGAYEPVGKVDIAAIRAKAQKPEDIAEPRSLADRSAAFSQPERLTSLPKPKVAKKIPTHSFTGTKAPTPGAYGFGGPTAPAAPTVGATSRTFADQGGKTPSQLWAEKKGKQQGGTGPVPAPITPAVTAQKSGSEWKSGYTGKSWAPVQTTKYDRSLPAGSEHEESASNALPSPTGGVSSLRDKFASTNITGASATSNTMPESSAPPPLPDISTRPAGAISLPGLPSRLPEDPEEEEKGPQVSEREESPVRIAIPVARSAEPEPAIASPEPPAPVPVSVPSPAREQIPVPEPPQPVHMEAAPSGGRRALIQYDYEKAEENEIELREGDYVTNIEMVDEDWWMGTNSQGDTGLFPSNYVELIEDEDAASPTAAAASVPAPAPVPAAPVSPVPQAAASNGPTATALYDYEAAEDNELSFPEGATIKDLEFPDEDWWFGHYNGQSGLFPANYVERVS